MASNNSRRVDMFLSCRPDSSFQHRDFIRELSYKFCQQLTALAEGRGARPSLFCRFLHAEGIWKRDVSLALMRLRIGGLGVCLITPDYLDAPAYGAEMRCLLEMEEESLIDLRLFSLGRSAYQNLAEIIKDRSACRTELEITSLEVTSTASVSETLAKIVWNIWDSPALAGSPSGFRGYALGATRRDSFRRLLSVFTSSDLPEIKFLFGTPPECCNVRDALYSAFHSGELVETDVERLRTIVLPPHTGKEKKLMAIDEYKRKWIDTDGLSWDDDEERARFIHAFDDAEKRSVAERPTVLGKRVRPENETRADRYRVIHSVPRNPHYVQLSLETPGSYDSELKEKILSSEGDKVVFAVACGMGGVGKTCALRGIGRLPEIKSRFPGGTFFASIGGDGGLGRLIEVVADMVWESGGHERAENIRSNKSLKFAIGEAGKWFKNERCLFMLYDVWCAKGISESDFERVASLAKHSGSRVVFSSRDINVALRGNWVKFKRRDQGGCESSRIILRCAGIDQPPSELQAHRAYNEVLKACNGLPLMLAIAGRALKALVLRGCDESKAWTKYSGRIAEKGIAAVSANDDDVENFERSVALSVELLEEVYECGNWLELVDSLCIARRQIPVPLHVFQRLWNTDADKAEEMIEKLGNFCLIEISTEEKDSAEETVVLVHDEILNYVCKRTKSRGGRRGKRGEICHDLIQSYIPSDKAHTPFAEAVGQVMDDGYIFENIFHLLRESGSAERAMELITDPRWVVGQMAKGGVGKITGDAELCMSLLEACGNIPSDCEVDMAVQFCRALQNACYSCSYDMRGCADAWRIWFELYGRLSWLVENRYVKKFLDGIGTWAPRPWLRPSRGLFPAAGSSLKHVITVPENCKILCERIDSDGVLVCYKNWRIRKLFTKRFQYDDATETDPIEFHYCGNVADIQHAIFAAKDKIIFGMKNGYVQINNCISQSGHTEDLWGHTRDVLSLRISLDGKRIVSGSKDGSVRVWDYDGNGWGSKVLAGHSGSVTSVSISSDGKRIVSGGVDECLRVSEHSRNGWGSKVLTGHAGSVESVSITSNGRRIVSGSKDNSVRVWNFVGSKWCCAVLAGHNHWVRSVNISSDGKRIVSGSDDKSVRVWEYDGNKWCSEVLMGHTSWVTSASISSDGKKVVSRSESDSVRVWENDGIGWCNEILTGHVDLVSSVSTSFDGRIVVSGGEDKFVCAWKNDGREWRSTKLLGHTATVDVAGISPDGKRILSQGKDGSARLWKSYVSGWHVELLPTDVCLDGEVGISSDGGIVASWNEKKLELNVCERYFGGWHTEKWYLDSQVANVSIALTGKKIVTASAKFVHLWTQEGQRRRQPEHVWSRRLITVQTSGVCCVCISPAGSIIVTGSKDGCVHVWELDNSEWHCEMLAGHAGSVRSVSISSDGKRILSGGDDQSVRLWKHKGNRWCSEVLMGHTGSVTGVSISSDGKRIVSGSFDNSVRVWERDGCEWCSEVLSGHSHWVTSVSISSDGEKIVSGSFDKFVRVWEFDGTGWCSEVLTGHTNWVTSVAITSDGSRIVSGSDDNSLRVWNHDRRGWCGEMLSRYLDRVVSVSKSADGKTIVSGSCDKSVRVEWHYNGWYSEVLTGQFRFVRSVSISSDGKRIVSGSWDKSLRVWESVEREQPVEGSTGYNDRPKSKMGRNALTFIVKSMPCGEGNESSWRSEELKGHTDRVKSVSTSSDGKRIVSGSDDKSVRVWDYDGIEWVPEVLTGHSKSVTSVSISLDGKIIVSGSYDESVRVWEHVGNGWHSEELTGHTDRVTSVSISSDGNRIVSGSRDRSVRVWERCGGSGWHSEVLTEHTYWAMSVSISSDGKRIVSGSYDNSVRVWEHDGRRWRSEVLTGHFGSVTSVGISSDGKRIVSGSKDNSVRVWEHDGSGWYSEVLTGHLGSVTSVSISSDGKRIVSGSYDESERHNESVRVWDYGGSGWVTDVLGDATRSVSSLHIAADKKMFLFQSEGGSGESWNVDMVGYGSIRVRSQLSVGEPDICNNGSRVVIEVDGKHMIAFKREVKEDVNWLITCPSVHDMASYKTGAVVLPSKSLFLRHKDCRFSVTARNMLTDVCERLGAAVKEVFVTASGICLHLSTAPFLAFIDVVDAESGFGD